MNLRLDTFSLKKTILSQYDLAKKITLFLIVAFVCPVLSQNTSSLDDTKKQANASFNNEEYDKAYKLYSQLVSHYPKDVEYNYRLGVCMLYAEPDKTKCISYLKFAVSNPEAAPKEATFYLGKAYHINYRFDEAIKYYNEYKKIASAAQQKKMQVEHEIETCNNGKHLLSNLSDLVVKNKKQLNEGDYFRSYDLQGIGGKLLVKPDEFKTAADKKKKDKSIVFIPKGSSTVYYSSYGNGDNKDIYSVTKTANGYSKPQMLQGINTQYDEDYPFLHPDGKTLYFSSKGYNSMGGYDIFKSTYDESSNSWSSPVNLEFPINSPDDDFLFVTDSLQQIAYFSTGRQSPPGKIDVLKISTKRRPVDMVVVKGTVTKENSEQSVNSIITVKNTNEMVLGTFNAADNGDYNLELPNGANLLFTVETPGQKTQTQKVSLPQAETSKPYRQIISYENGILKIKNYFDEVSSSEDYLQYLSVIEKKAKLEVNDTESPSLANNASGNTSQTKGTNNNSNTQQTENASNSNVAQKDSNNTPSMASTQLGTNIEQKEKQIEEIEKANEKIKESVEDIKTAIASKEDELATTKSKSQKKELQTAIAELKTEQAEKQTQIADNETKIKELSEAIASEKAEAEAATKIEANQLASGSAAYIQQLSKEAEEFEKKASDLKKSADSKSGNEKQKLLNEAKNMENKANEKHLQVADIVKTENAAAYSVNSENIELLKKGNKLSSAEIAEANRFNSEAAVVFKQAVSMRQEAQTYNQNNKSALLGALSNVEEKEAEAILKQQQAIDILKKGNPNVALKTPATNNVQSANVQTDIASYQKMYTANEEELNLFDKKIKSKQSALDQTPSLKSEYDAAVGNVEAAKALKQKSDNAANNDEKINKLMAAIDKQNEALQQFMMVHKKASAPVAIIPNTNKQDLDFLELVDSDIIGIATKGISKGNNNNNNASTPPPNTKEPEPVNTVPTTNIKSTAATSTINPNESKNDVLRRLEKENTSVTQVADYFDANTSVVKTPQASSILKNSVSEIKYIEEEKQRIDAQLKNYSGGNFSGSPEELKTKISRFQADADKLNKQARELRTQAQSKTGVEKEHLLQTARSMEDEAQANSLQAAIITQRINEAEYQATGKAITELLTKLRTDNHRLYVDLEEKNAALIPLNNQVQALHAEARGLDDYASRLGTMSNAEDKENVLLQNQAEIIEALLAEYPNYVVVKPDLIEVNNEPPTALLQRKQVIQEKQYSELENLTNALSLDYETSKKSLPANLSENQAKVKQVADELNAESKRLLIQSVGENDKTERTKLLTMAAKTGNAALERINALNSPFSSVSTNNTLASSNKNNTANNNTNAATNANNPNSTIAANKNASEQNNLANQDATQGGTNVNNKGTSSNETLEQRNSSNENNTSLTNNDTNKNDTNSPSDETLTQDSDDEEDTDSSDTDNDVADNNSQSSNKPTPTQPQTQRNDIADNSQSSDNSNNTQKQIENKNEQQPLATNVNNRENVNTTNNRTNNATQSTDKTTVKNNNASSSRTGGRTVQINGLEIIAGNAYSDAKPIPIDAPMSDGLVFRVQIGAFRNLLPNNTFKGLSPLNIQSTPNGYYRYTAGNFNEYELADAVKNDLKKLGYEDAFVVGYYNGKRISLSEAMEILNKEGRIVDANAPQTTGITVAANIPDGSILRAGPATQNVAVVTKELEKTRSLLYTVQIGVYNKATAKQNVLNLRPVFTEALSNGLYRYTAGIYNDVDKLLTDKKRVVELGIRDAFVSAYLNGKRISFNEAKQRQAEDPNIKMEPESPIIFPGTNTANSVQTTNNTNNAVEPFSNGVVSYPAATAQNGVKENEAGISFKVQIGAFSNRVPADVAEKYMSVKNWPVEHKQVNGLYIYNVGNFTEAKFAQELKEEVKRLGITDAFVTVYKDGKKLPPSEAYLHLAK